MMFMNEAEIQNANDRQHACPNVRKGYKLLARLVEATNNQSDGWHSWPAPCKSAEKLMELLQTAGPTWTDTRGTITADQLKKAISPIRRMVTVQNKRQSSGFKFDVDAALKD